MEKEGKRFEHSGNRRNQGCNPFQPEPYYCDPCAPEYPGACKVSNNHSKSNKPIHPSNGWSTGDARSHGHDQIQPCGLNQQQNTCGTCCWDSTLCFPPPESCPDPGTEYVTMSVPDSCPTIDPDVSNLLSIYNYSVQRLISRGIKFITSYYDWLYCQNLDQFNKAVCYKTSDCSDPSHMSGAPSFTGAGFLPPASLFTQVVQVLNWGMFSFKEIDIGQCFCNNFCSVLQLFGVLGETTGSSNTVLRDLVLNTFMTGDSHCSTQPTYLGCGNLYNESQLVDYTSGMNDLIDVLISILTSVLTSSSSDILASGGSDDVDGHDFAEAILNKLCCCLQEAAEVNPCSPFKSNGHKGPSHHHPDHHPHHHHDHHDVFCPPHHQLEETGSPQPKLTHNHPHNDDPRHDDPHHDDLYPNGFRHPCHRPHSFPPNGFGIHTHEPHRRQSYLRQQFFSMFVDLLQFLLFDRDCSFDEQDCCPDQCYEKPVSTEDWLQTRCRAGTNNGKCVVCSTTCKSWRQKDDYSPLLSVLYAAKYSVTFLGLDRSGGKEYAKEVEQVYNSLLNDYWNCYSSNAGNCVTFNPDCAAPQFCCSTQFRVSKCVSECGFQKCSRKQCGFLQPVPCLDFRRASHHCGSGNDYIPGETVDNGWSSDPNSVGESPIYIISCDPTDGDVKYTRYTKGSTLGPHEQLYAPACWGIDPCTVIGNNPQNVCSDKNPLTCSPKKFVDQSQCRKGPPGTWYTCDTKENGDVFDRGSSSD